MIPLGPQLIGQTEKALKAVLRRFLAGDDLTEEQWVTLRLTEQFSGDGDLAAFISDKSHFENPARTLAALERRAFVTGNTLTDAGREVLTRIGAEIAEHTGAIWSDLPDADAAARTLNTVLERYNTVLRQHEAADAQQA